MSLRANLNTLMVSAGCEAGAIRWVGERKKMLCPQIVNLSVRNFAGFGVDEVRLSNASPVVAGREVAVSVVGSRTFTLLVQIDTNTTADAGSSWSLAETIRNRLYLPSVLEKMPGLCIALLSIGTLTTTEIETDNRFSSRTTLEINFATTTETIDCPITYVETVELTVESGDGTFPDINLEAPKP